MDFVAETRNVKLLASFLAACSKQRDLYDENVHSMSDKHRSLILKVSYSCWLYHEFFLAELYVFHVTI